MPVTLQLSADEVARLRLLDSELSKVQLQFQRNSKLLQEMREAAIRAESQATVHAQVRIKGGSDQGRVAGSNTRTVVCRGGLLEDSARHGSPKLAAGGFQVATVL